MRQKVIFSVVLVVLILSLSVVAAYNFKTTKQISMKAKGGDVLNIAHFTDFVFEKARFSGWGRIGNWSEGEYSGKGSVSVFGRTSSGNRASIRMNGNLDSYEETGTEIFYVLDGYATFKSGKLRPKKYHTVVGATYHKNTGLIDLDGYGIYYGSFHVRDMKVKILKNREI